LLRVTKEGRALSWPQACSPNYSLFLGGIGDPRGGRNVGSSSLSCLFLLLLDSSLLAAAR